MDMYDNISQTASLVADRSRTAMLMALMDGMPMSATELARIAHVSPQTASTHLMKLVGGRLLSVEKCGRNRYYRLASPDVATLVQAFASIAPPAKVHSLRESDRLHALGHGHICYDHIAGKLGVTLTNAIADAGYWVESNGGYVVTDIGVLALRGLGVEVPQGPNPWVPRHVDWTERTFHVAGPIAASLMEILLHKKWIEVGSVRGTIRFTPAGQDNLQSFLGVQFKLDA